MSKTTIRLLAVSAIALGAAFTGYTQAQAFSFGSSFLLAQAGGGAGTGGTGGPSGAGDGPATPRNPEPHKTPPAGSTTSPSAGVPAQCAAMTNAAERQACIDRMNRANPTMKK